MACCAVRGPPRQAAGLSALGGAVRCARCPGVGAPAGATRMGVTAEAVRLGWLCAMRVLPRGPSCLAPLCRWPGPSDVSSRESPRGDYTLISHLDRRMRECAHTERALPIVGGGGV